MANPFNVEYHKAGGYNETSHPESISPLNDPWYKIELDSSIGFGDIVILKTKYGFWETHSGIALSICGKGWGIRLYRAIISLALRKRLTVKSSLNYNENAERVWKSNRLRQVFKIRKTGNRYTVLRRK